MNINTLLKQHNPQLMDVDSAKAAWMEYRRGAGYTSYRPLLTQPNENIKLAKDMVTYGLSLAQSTTSGVANTCPFSTPVCRACCVANNGNGRYDSVGKARALKTRFLVEDPSAFLTLLTDEIRAASAKHGDQLRVRLNTFSDIRWEEVSPWLFTLFGDVKFYDYTKDWNRQPPANYTLVRSASERTKDFDIVSTVKSGTNVAVVFSTKRTDALPGLWNGLTVVNGDKSDNRSDDGKGVIVGLRAKGAMINNGKDMVRDVRQP